MNIAYAETLKYELLEPLPGITETSGGFNYLSSVYNIALTICIVFGLIMLVVAGIEYATSFASPSNTEAAKHRIWNAIGGIVLALMSVLLLETVNSDIISGTVAIPKGEAPKNEGGSGGPPVGSKCTGPTCYTEEQARALLKQYDIGTKPACPPNVSKNCVTLDGVRQETLIEAVWMKQTCGCEIFITGGTEDGHSSGHANGYKIDIRPNPQLNDWIVNNMREAGKLGGYPVYVNDKPGVGCNGAGWMHEDSGTTNDHWDVDIRGAQNGLNG